MEAPITFSIRDKSITVFIKLSTVSKILIRTLSKVILVYKVISRIVRRVGCPYKIDTITRFPLLYS